MYTVVSNMPIAKDVYRMVLCGDTSAIAAPGQFAHLIVPGFYLRRPISICDWDDATLTLIYKVVGGGTKAMSTFEAGMQVDMLVGLGNGFDVHVPTVQPLLVGGGVGTPPLYGLCKALVQKGIVPQVVIGFEKASDVLLADDFAALGAKVTITTVDGSAGIKGFVTAAMGDIAHDYVYTCGPEPMLKAVCAASGAPGQYSFEERMACGFGACMGCTCKTKYGNKRICKDGPVLVKEEIIW